MLSALGCADEDQDDPSVRLEVLRLQAEYCKQGFFFPAAGVFLANGLSLLHVSGLEFHNAINRMRAKNPGMKTICNRFHREIGPARCNSIGTNQADQENRDGRSLVVFVNGGK